MHQKLAEKFGFDRIADDSGFAIAVVDETSHEVSTANNNSICRNLNPDGKFEGMCAAFCGTALAETAEVGSAVSFTCHAGLECRALPLRCNDKEFVAIVGRTFANAENYRKATERSITGDWKQYSPSEFFDNILITGSVAALDKTAQKVESIIAESKESVNEMPPVAEQPEQVEAKQRSYPRPHKKTAPAISNIVERFNREQGLDLTPARPEPPEEPINEPHVSQNLVPEPAPASQERSVTNAKRAAEAGAWRSFFGSLLKTDYAQAADSILEFVSQQYNLSALMWLEKRDNRLENAAGFGKMKKRKVRLGIACDDPRLMEAHQNEMPLELQERSSSPSEPSSRVMSLFPIGVGGEISAAIAVLEQIEDDTTKKQIARICHSIASQMEILRLRNAVTNGETLSNAVRYFSEGLKRIDAPDLWLNLTQNAAELLKAERASLLVYDEKAEALEIKAMIGSRSQPPEVQEVGGRVARVVFEKNKPVSVFDVGQTGLPPAPVGREYKTASFLSYPISLGKRKIGVMNFTDKASGQAFDRHSVELFQAIAPQLAIAIDRASLKEKAGEFEQLSVTDPLTGLLNRRYMEERLTEEIKRSNRHGFPMSFMMVDVDNFKSYNDDFGHPEGDEALKLVGHVIRETLRGADVAARFGGEEFSILLPQTTGEEAAAIAERIRKGIESADFVKRQVTISIGIATCSAELCTSKDMILAADKALYEAKRQGRNRVLSYEQMQFKATGNNL